MLEHGVNGCFECLVLGDSLGPSLISKATSRHPLWGKSTDRPSHSPEMVEIRKDQIQWTPELVRKTPYSYFADGSKLAADRVDSA